MRNILAKCISFGFKANSPAEDDLVEQVQKKLQFRLPADYIAFMKLTNGGEGWIGSGSYLFLYALDELEKINAGYRVEEFTPGFFYLGSDGGGEAFAFDLHTTPLAIVMIPFIGNGVKDVIFMANSFTRFLEIQIESVSD